VSVPYCEDCSRHAVWASGSRYAGILLRLLLVFLFAPLLGVLFLVFLPQGALQTVAFLLFGCGVPFILATALGVYEYKRIPRVLDGRHSSKGLAVQVADFGKDSLKIRVYNEKYAKEMAVANHAAVS
jgi:hypothetical protein